MSRKSVLLTSGFVAAWVWASACTGDDPPVTDVTDAGGDTAVAIDSGGDTNVPADSGGDSSSDAGLDAPYDVRALAGLRLWLESSKGVTTGAGTALASWRDSSNHWADAGPDSGAPDGGAHVAVASTGTAGPSPSVDPNGPAGRPAIQISSSGGNNFHLVITNHEDFDVGKGDFVIAVAGKVTSVSGGSLWRLMTQTSQPQGVQFSQQDVCWFTGKCTSPAFTPSNDVHVYVARRKSMQLLFRTDGSSRGTYDLSGDGNPQLGVLTFQAPFVTIGLGMDTEISEIVHAVGPTSDSDLAALEAYLKAKYGIP
jgi:hypothetical protein